MKYTYYENAMIEQVSIMIRSKHADTLSFQYVTYTINSLATYDMEVTDEEFGKLLQVERMLIEYVRYLKWDRRLNDERK